jgi:hypothetical protein
MPRPRTMVVFIEQPSGLSMVNSIQIVYPTSSYYLPVSCPLFLRLGLNSPFSPQSSHTRLSGPGRARNTNVRPSSRVSNYPLAHNFQAPWPTLLAC